MSEGTPNWGIEPVPERLRVLGFGDSFLLWVNLGISLLVLVAASYFGLSLKQAVLATIALVPKQPAAAKAFRSA
jgi:hypothetical protein